MNSKKFMTALENLSKEKGIDKDVIFDAMELALTSAYFDSLQRSSRLIFDGR